MTQRSSRQVPVFLIQEIPNNRIHNDKRQKIQSTFAIL